MAADVFGTDTQLGGAWQLDGAVLEIEDGGNLVVTSAAINYVRQVTKFTALNSKKRYLVTGEADGTLQLGAIIGPSKDIKVFIERYSRECDAKRNTITVKPAGIEACEDENQPVEFICKGILMNALNVSVQQVGSSMTVVNAGMGFNFVQLQVN
jgi:hypothetical protein